MPVFTSRILVLLTLMLIPLASAQLELTTRLTPWPPEGWPAGAQGEVHAVTVEDITTEDIDPDALQSVLTFPVSDTGEVTYRLPEELPRNARRFYQEASLDAFQVCPEVAPSLSPPGAQLVLLNLVLYADGELWGFLDLSVQSGDLFSLEVRSFVGLLYAREPFRVAGSGYCPGEEVEMETVFELREGLNLLELMGTVGLAGGTLLLTTTETLDLPQTPVGIGISGEVSGGAP